MRADPLEDSKVLTEWLGEWLGDGRSLLLMTDYDGTLTPHVPNPAEASLIQRAQRSLSALARTPQVRLAIISGRDLGDPDTNFNLQLATRSWRILTALRAPAD